MAKQKKLKRYTNHRVINQHTRRRVSDYRTPPATPGEALTRILDIVGGQRELCRLTNCKTHRWEAQVPFQYAGILSRSLGIPKSWVRPDLYKDD